MCNSMHVPRNDLVLEVIERNEGEKMYLDTWVNLINEHLPKPKKVNKRELTHIVMVLGKNNNILVKKEIINKNIFYEFNKITAE